MYFHTNSPLHHPQEVCENTQHTRRGSVKSNVIFVVLLWIEPSLEQTQSWLSWGSESLSPPFVCVLGVTEHVVLGLGTLVWWPGQSSCFPGCHPDMWALRKHCFCCLWPPYSLKAALNASLFLECCFICVACLWWRMRVFQKCELLKRQKLYAWQYGGPMDWWFIVMYAHCFLFLNIYFDGLYFITEKS